MMKKLILVLLLLAYPSMCLALVTLSSSTTFPYNALTNTTYQLSEDISCAGTCIVLGPSADNAIIDLNGHTMTFGTSNAVTVVNADFEAWTGSVPDNWTVLSGSVSSSPAVKYGTYDMLSTTAAFRVRSDAFTINGGQTYNAWILAKANSGSSGTLRILNATDNSILASLPMGSSGQAYFNDFAATSGEEAGALKYTATATMSVKLEFESAGGYAFRVAEIGMSPCDHYGVASWGYRNNLYFPDLIPYTFGRASNVTVQNGTITQGNGHASYASGLFGDGENDGWIVSGVTLNINGNNSGGVYGFKSIANSTINSTSTRVFNRKYGAKAGAATGPKFYTTALSVDNLTINNFPQYGVIGNKCFSTGGDSSSIEIKNSTFRNKGIVTEPYAISFSGTKNVSVHDNIIDPGLNIGRGILVDAVGCNDINESVTGAIYGNQFLNIYEEANYEYPASGMESVGIRIRNWGGLQEGHTLDIYGNSFSYTNKANGTHATYGVNITASSAIDALNIHNNTFDVNAYDSSQWAAGVVFQTAGNISASRLMVTNNTITSNSYGIGLDSNDGVNAKNISINSNIITAGVAPIRFGTSTYYGTDFDIDIYCNKLISNTATSYPLYLNGTLSDINIDHNLITNSNSGGYEAWADENESTDVLFYGNGTIDVTGGGSVGTAGSATNGTTGCSATAGADFTYTPPADVCDALHLELCTTEGACSTTGNPGYWYNGMCNATAEVVPTCSPTRRDLCVEADCDDPGLGYWYNSVCNAAPQNVVGPRYRVKAVIE